MAFTERQYNEALSSIKKMREQQETQKLLAFQKVNARNSYPFSVMKTEVANAVPRRPEKKRFPFEIFSAETFGKRKSIVSGSEKRISGSKQQNRNSTNKKIKRANSIPYISSSQIRDHHAHNTIEEMKKLKQDCAEIIKSNYISSLIQGKKDSTFLPIINSSPKTDHLKNDFFFSSIQPSNGFSSPESCPNTRIVSSFSNCLNDQFTWKEVSSRPQFENLELLSSHNPEPIHFRRRSQFAFSNETLDKLMIPSIQGVQKLPHIKLQQIPPGPLPNNYQMDETECPFEKTAKFGINNKARLKFCKPTSQAQVEKKDEDSLEVNVTFGK